MFDQSYENAEFVKKYDRKTTGMQKAFDVTLNVLLVLLLILLAVRLVYKPVIVDGHSMDPTLYSGQRVALSRLD
ncbi:MAG: S26 family signal peptidase, partial [Candidatus Neoclostridium sp.]